MLRGTCRGSVVFADDTPRLEPEDGRGRGREAGDTRPTPTVLILGLGNELLKDDARAAPE
jgi:hypothetical protein